MLRSSKQPLEKGQKVKGTLQFETAAKVDIAYTVEALGGPSGQPTGTIIDVATADHLARRVRQARVTAPMSPKAASGRPTYQRSRARARVRR